MFTFKRKCFNTYFRNKTLTKTVRFLNNHKAISLSVSELMILKHGKVWEN
jgi:hypothetical protein